MKGSQDCWIFRSDLEIRDLNDADFEMGIPGCDSRIAHIFHENGYIVLNPSLSVKIYHVHNNNFRTWLGMPAVKGSHLEIEICTINTKPRYNTFTR